jgi:thiamine-phosphate pyrophosphorylase
VAERTSRPGRLHVITDVVLQTRYSHGELAALAIEGGADVIQYREKSPLVTRELMAAAREVAAACAAGGALCIIDDRVDVAAAVGAEAIHLGRNDLPVEVARRLLGASAIIGGTANSFAEAESVWATPIDYLGVGPVFGTASKANPAPVLGLDHLRTIAAACPVPVIAIGNIAPETVADVMDAGAYGVAVLSRVTCADNPAAAAREFAAAMASWLAGRR